MRGYPYWAACMGRGEVFLSRWWVFSHRTHRINRAFLRTVSNSQKASGIQRSQNVIAIVDMFKGLHEAFVLLIGVSRWSRPSLWGRGRGRGHYLLWMLCVLFICVHLWEKEHFETRWGVFSLTERTEFTEHFCAQFRAHRTPSAYRVHRGLSINISCNVLWYRLT